MMHTDNERLYKNILEECIVLVEQVTQNEQKQVGLALEIGKKVDQLVTGAEDGGATLKRLTRDISKRVARLFPLRNSVDIVRYI
jgi:uncharacterized protein with ATP-grasp and redox domains